MNIPSASVKDGKPYMAPVAYRDSYIGTADGLIAALDYVWQRWTYMQRMRMSRRDIRDEVKQQEGDPHIRARLRQIRLERSRKRMMQNIPKSTVVITNPTH